MEENNEIKKSDTISDILRPIQRALSELKTAHLYMKSLGLDDELQASDEEQELWDAVERANRQVQTAYNRLKERIP